MKILVIEDEPGLRESVRDYLHYQGYICETAADYLSAKDKIAQFSYVCIVVDIGLPFGSGIDLVKELKWMESKAGIIIISAKNSLEDKLQGLESGSDDYLTKPFHLSELNARINAILRRRSFNGHKEIIFNEITLIPESRLAAVNGKTVELTEKEYNLLEYFITNKRRVLTKAAIAEHIWGDQYAQVSDYDFIYTHIKNLRKKLVDSGGNDYIKTIHGSGYRFTDN